jgi:hypothetical protein
MNEVSGRTRYHDTLPNPTPNPNLALNPLPNLNHHLNLARLDFARAATREQVSDQD